MKKMILVLSLLLSAGMTSAQVQMPNPMSGGGGGGGSVAAGDAVSGCTIDSIVYIDASGNLACDQAVVHGSASTAGLAITKINGTITGASATSNFLNITGTFPATLSAETAGALMSIDSSGTNSVRLYGLKVVLEPGWTGQNISIAGAFDNQTVPIGSAGNIGVWGNPGGAGTNRVGGFFSLYPSGTTPSITGMGKSALVADNGLTVDNIFIGRDNGTAVFTIADGGAVAATSYITQAGILGELYETGGSTAITITTAGTYYPWISTTAGASSNMTVSATTDDITVVVPGIYRITSSCSFTATGNAVVGIRLFEESTGQTNCSATRKISAGGDVGSASLSCMVASVADDSYTLRFTSNSDSDTVTPTECNLNAAFVGN